MRVIERVDDMQTTALRIREEGQRIGFVPTMGCLHEGHLSLVREARKRADVTVVSVFVNPTQFGPGEDYASYPRVFDRDRALCTQEGVGILFHPDAKDVYAPDHSVFVEETRLSIGLCGASRAGHFRGVATVVAKLFHIVLPHVAVFGQKDAQQARVIEQMVRDLNFPLEVVVAPTVREPDGLAMSSRNRHLSQTERRDAACLSRGLLNAWELFASGERAAGALERAVAEQVHAAGAVIDYVQVIDSTTLNPVSEANQGTLIAVAARIGGTRLIDNLIMRDGAGLRAFVPPRSPG